MSRTARTGGTLINVLAVIAMLVIAVGLFLPATRRVREASARMQCVNDLKQIMLGLHNYHEDLGPSRFGYRSNVPDGPAFPPGSFGPGTIPEDRLSWMVTVLPYLEQESLYKQIAVEKDYAGNPLPAQTAVKTFVCPESTERGTGAAISHYVAMAGIGLDAPSRPAGAVENGFMGYDRTTMFKMIEDGSSNTIALMETRVSLGPWARGGSSTLRGLDLLDAPIIGENRPFGGHNGGTNVAMADGSVRFIRASIDPKVLAAAVTVAGGEKVDLD